MSLEELEGRLPSAGGIDLHWVGLLPAAPDGLALFVHGVGEHCGRYRHVLEHFAGHGLGCFAFDLRGHGRSDGRRGHVDSFDEYDADVRTVRCEIDRRFPGAPLTLVGHSMGGLIALRHTLLHPERQRATILSSPALGVSGPAGTRPFRWLIERLAAWRSELRVPSMLGTRFLSRSPGVAAAYRSDPLVTGRLSFAWFLAFVDAIRDAYARAPTLAIPLLLMQSGADRLVDPDGARRWAEHAPAALVTLHVWPGLYHEMFNEPERGEVFELMLGWIRSRPTRDQVYQTERTPW